MLWFQNKKLQFDFNRCCQCGTCLAVCKKQALTAELKHNGTYDIRWDNHKCSMCEECIKCCPAHTLPGKYLSEQDWNELSGTFLGYARDLRIRNNASSGGVARTLLKTSLESSFCDQAYCLVNTNHYPWAEGRYLKGKVDLDAISNSMYIPILVNKNLKKMRDIKTLLVIGTNCQLTGMSLFYRNSSVNLVKIALLCKQQKTFEFTKFIARRLKLKGINYSTPIKYRRYGWPGSMEIEGKKLRYEDAAALPYGKKLWMIQGCRFCTHPLGWNADITIADPWGINHDDKIGKNLIIVQSKLGKQLLDLCDNDLVIEKIDLPSVMQSVDWKNIKQKQRMISFTLGNDSPWKTHHILVKIAKWQKYFYEYLLERVPLPRFILRIINKIPFLENFL